MSEQQMQRTGHSIELPDHETLFRLAKEHPPAFEALRQQLLEDCINSAPERMRARLRGLQFRVDAIRRLTPSPLGATVKVYALMWDSFLELNRQLQDFERLTQAKQQASPVATVQRRPQQSAQVIQFRPQQIVAKNSPVGPA